MDIWNMIEQERGRLADDLEQLTAEQWATQSQCDRWTVKEVAAHLVTPFETSTPKFLFTLLKNRRNFDKTIIELAAGLNARSSTDEIVAKLRQHRENRWTPPRRGAEIPLSEIVVHGQDIRRVLDLEHNIPAPTIELALDGVDDPAVRNDYAARIGLAVDHG